MVCVYVDILPQPLKKAWSILKYIYLNKHERNIYVITSLLKKRWENSDTLPPLGQR